MLEKIRDYYRNLRPVYKLLFYILSGIIWSVSNVGYTRFTTGFPAWITFTPFLFFIYLEDYKKGALYSLVFGAALYTSHLWWMTSPAFDLVRLGNYNPLVTLLIWGGIGAVCFILWVLQGTVYSVFFVTLKFISRKNPYLFLAAAPFVFTTLDFFFPKIWGDQLGYSQYVSFNLSQIADIFGVPGLTFLIICCNSALVAVLLGLANKEKANKAKKEKKDNKNITKLLHFVPLVFVLVLTLLSIVYGYRRVNSIEKSMAESRSAKIGIVQGNISGFDKRTLGFKDILATYNELSRQIMKEGPELVVWPESSVTLSVPDTMELFTWLNKFGYVPLLFGTHYYEKEAGRLYNSLMLVSANNRKGGVYKKRKLVPLSEELPVTRLNFLMTYYGYAYFSRGEEYVQLKSNDLVIAGSICYEAVFPDYIRKIIQPGKNSERANILINGTNDSWFGPFLEPDMHLAISGFRSIENRISLVRATCTGYSAVFDPTGFLQYKSQLYKEEAVVRDVVLMQEKTFFQQGGWLFVYITAFIVLFSCMIRLFIDFVQKKKNKKN